MAQIIEVIHARITNVTSPRFSISTVDSRAVIVVAVSSVRGYGFTGYSLSVQ